MVCAGGVPILADLHENGTSSSRKTPRCGFVPCTIFTLFRRVLSWALQLFARALLAQLTNRAWSAVLPTWKEHARGQSRRVIDIAMLEIWPKSFGMQLIQ